MPLRTSIRAALLTGAVLFLSAAAAQVAMAATPRFCQPLAFADYVLGVGYQAVVIVPATCKAPARLRKYNPLSRSAEPHLTLPPGSVNRIWLFTHYLQFTLDGTAYKRLAVKR